MIPDPGFQKPDAVAGRHRLEEVVDLVVVLERGQQVGLAVHPGLDEVVAVHGRRHLDLVEAGGHELEQGHLGGGVLHGHAVRAQVGVRAAPLELLARRVVEVVDEDLLGQGQRSMRRRNRLMRYRNQNEKPSLVHIAQVVKNAVNPP